MKFLLIIIITLIKTINIFSCTTVIISGRVTTDGRPILLKHRDSDHFQNRVVYLKDGNYDYIGLVNSSDINNSEVWIGCNTAGFAIMNSASYNLKPMDDNTKISDKEGEVMKKALQTCKTVNDFEELLKTLPKPLGVEANFGVIDAYGNAAYFETNNFNYYKYDVNDPNVAPYGFLIRTNYSFSGEKDKGYGYIRYNTAENILLKALEKNNLSCNTVMREISRSLVNSFTNIDLTKKSNIFSDYVNFEDFIPRFSSTSSVIIHGVKKGESPEYTIMWSILGFPLTSVAVPVLMGGGEFLPKIIIKNNDNNSILCEKSLELKEKCFPEKKELQKKYIKIKELFNDKRTGIIQKLKNVEDEIYNSFYNKVSIWRKDKINKEEVTKFYNWIDKFVIEKYFYLFKI